MVDLMQEHKCCLEKFEKTLAKKEEDLSILNQNN